MSALGGYEMSVLHALEGFDVPFICVDEDSRVTRASSAARKVLASVTDPSNAMGAMARAATAALNRPRCRTGDRAFEVLGEIPAAGLGGTMVIHRPQRAMPGVAAVVVLRSDSTKQNDSEIVSLLTPRESEVARLVADGAPNKEIAARLSISEHTARHHTERLFEKLGVRNRTSLARLFAR